MRKNLIDSQLKREDIIFQQFFDAIRSAGGITEFSDLSKVEVIRKDTLTNGGGKKSNLPKFLKNLEDNEINHKYKNIRW